MNINEFLYTRSYEQEINNNSLYYSYQFPYDEVKQYVDDIIAIPIEQIIQFLLAQQTAFPITTKMIFQFSSFDDATQRFCELVFKNNNPGLKFIDIGKILLNDGKTRKDSAYIKYGENHAKTAEQLGLAFSLEHTYFLSCLGQIYCQLDNNKQQKLLSRLILRNELVSRLIPALYKDNVNLRSSLYMISDSTYNRRRSNIKKVFSVLSNSKEYDFSFINEHLHY